MAAPPRCSPDDDNNNNNNNNNDDDDPEGKMSESRGGSSGPARNGAAPEPASGSAGPGRCLRREHRPGAFLRPPPPPLPLRCPGPAMPRLRLLLLLLLLLIPHLGRAAAAAASPPSPGNSTEPPRAARRNETQPVSEHESGPRLSVGSGLPVLRRAVYVLSALSVLAALYFVLRAFRLKKPQRKKYGLLSSQDENIELGSLDSDEDTVFETQNLRR